MAIISLIAAVDEDFGLGYRNQLLCHLPADLKHFKEVTMGKPIIMGRKTFESIGKPLPGRLNIVLSKQQIAIEGVTVLPSLEHALKQVNDVPEIMIIGGATLFEKALPLAHRIYLTVIHHHFLADVFFPKINGDHWIEYSKQNFSHDEKNSFDMTFYQYNCHNVTISTLANYAAKE
jgi:dihydrofolate reductase